MKLRSPYPTILIIAAFFFFFLLAQASTPGKALAVDLTLAWDLNVDPDLAGYKLHLGYHSRDYTQTVDLGLVTQYTIQNLTVGTLYYFAVTAYTNKGVESDFSNEAWYPSQKIFFPFFFKKS